MGKHFPDGPVLLTLIVSLVAVGALALAVDCGDDNQRREQLGLNTQVIT